MTNSNSKKIQQAQIREEFLDGYDEELELELDEGLIDHLMDSFHGETTQDGSLDRRLYFKELFRLQGELVKPVSYTHLTLPTIYSV